MSPLKIPGLKFFAEQIDDPTTGLGLTMSTYGIQDLEGGPRRNELYVVCKDGSIQSVYEPSRSIGWELIEDGAEWYYRVTQMNHPRKRCSIRYHSRIEDPPAGRGSIGSVVTTCRRIATPQEAAIIENKDDDAEITSELHAYIDGVRAAAASMDAAQYTGDMGKIATIDPLLAHCAVIVNDPVQTAAMAKFAEGKMSYAEMRGLCG
jgi:hypothetical protein